MNIKITFIIHGLSVGGAEKFLISLANSLFKSKYTITIISLSKNNPLQNELDPNIKFISIPRINKFSIKPLFVLRKVVSLHKPNIVFCINFFTFFITACSTLFLRQKFKRLISYHSTTLRSKQDYIKTKLFTLFLNKEDLILTVSNNQRDYTSNRFKIPHNKFKTIHNGIDTNKWTPLYDLHQKNLIKKQLDIPIESKVIVITAAFRSEKNHIGALKALKILINNFNINAYLLFVGDGYMKDEIQNQIVHLDLSNFVKLAGLQSHILPYYHASDIFSLTSTSIETLSVAALEAMSCGLPCVLTDIGGASELIQEDLNGYLCSFDEYDIADKWHKALTGNFNSNSIRNSVISNFDLQKMISFYKEEFENSLYFNT